MLRKLLPFFILHFSLLTLLNGYEIVIDKTEKMPKVEKPSTFLRDNTKEVVTDSATGLMWQDDSRAKTVKRDWEDAKEYCQNLELAGYDDWFLPSISQLETIADYSRYNLGIKKEFQNTTSSNYWSSSSSVSYSKYAWSVYFKNGYSNGYGRESGKYSVRCARSGQ